MPPHVPVGMRYLGIAIITFLLIAQSTSFRDGDSSSTPPIQSLALSPSTKLLIVTTEALREGFTPLAEWKNTIGIPTSIVTMEEILAAHDGRDDAEKLLDHLSSRDRNMTYLLLGGDAELVPVRYLHAQASPFGLDDAYLSDVYYSSPWSEWDQDGDSIFGEPEEIDPNMTFPVGVGRVPASTKEEAARYSQKVISYESSPPEGDWFDRAILASSLMDRPNIEDDPLTPEDEGFENGSDNGHLAIQRMKDILPYSVVPIEAHDYEFDEGGLYNTSGDSLGLDSLPDLISAGASIVTFAGQSFFDADEHDPPTAYSLAQWFEPSGTINMTQGFGPALSVEDLADLNNGGMLPVAYFSSCDSANFSDPTDSDLSNITLAPEGGAICMIGSTGISWRGEYEEGGYGNWFLLPAFWERFYGTGTPGPALYSLKEAYLSSYFGYTGLSERVLAGLYGYNYIGDPSLQAWTASPKRMSLSVDRIEVHAGGEELTVSVRTNSGSPVYDARVSVYLSGEGPYIGRTGPDGTATIMTSFTSAGNATVTATKAGYEPVSADIEVLPWPPDLSFVDGSLRVYPERPTTGQRLDLSIDVRSDGGPYQGQVTVVLYAGPTEGSPLGTQVKPAPQGEEVTYEFSVESPNGAWDLLTIVLKGVIGELDLSDNVLAIPIHINAPPKVIGGNHSMDEDTKSYFDLAQTVFDPDTPLSEMEFQLGAGTPDWIEMSDRFLTCTPPVNWSGEVEIDLQADDGLERSSGRIRIVVAPVNDPPILMGLPSSLEASVDEPLIVDLDPVDAEGESLTLTVVEGPDNVTIVGHVLRFIPSPGQEGTYNIVVNVSDPSLGYSIHASVITVGPALDLLHFEVPSLRLPRARVDRHYMFQFLVGGAKAPNATFTDNTTLFDIDPLTGFVSFTPSADDEGEHWIRITVESDGTSISRSFILEVLKEDRLPSWLAWALGAIALSLLGAAVLLYRWKGRAVDEYGVEE